MTSKNVIDFCQFTLSGSKHIRFYLKSEFIYFYHVKLVKNNVLGTCWAILKDHWKDLEVHLNLKILRIYFVIIAAKLRNNFEHLIVGTIWNEMMKIQIKFKVLINDYISFEGPAWIGLQTAFILAYNVGFNVPKFDYIFFIAELVLGHNNWNVGIWSNNNYSLFDKHACAWCHWNKILGTICLTIFHVILFDGYNFFYCRQFFMLCPWSSV